MSRAVGQWLAIAVIGAVVGGCAPIGLGALNAAGPISDAQRHLFEILAIVLVAVAGPVLVLTPLIAWHYRLSNKDSAFRPNWDFSWWLEGLIWLPPAAIVIGLSVLAWNYTHQLDPYKPIAAAQPPLRVQAVALDWKWLFIYPDEHIATVNELDVPVGRPVQVSLTSGTVMQSLLIPRLAGQVYAMPGMRTVLNFAASRPGLYRGANVQYNGAGFSGEAFDVVARLPAEYAGWLAQVKAKGQGFDQTAFAGLSGRGSVARPVFYARVPDGLFGRFLGQSQMPAGRMAP